ncbi:hypothetical protein O1W69_04135 [Chlamydia sp. 12-01]|uniref:hypothetical protein n=1 Tax=Chlamydia sp. 12-01 TaxID=3002742 RepID=UPI0035D453C5
MSSVPSSPIQKTSPEFPTSVQQSDLDKLISSTEKKIKRSNILAIVTIIAAALLAAIGIICAIVFGINGLWALPVGAILCTIVLLIAIHQYRSHLESKLPAPRKLDAEDIRKSLETKPSSGSPTPEVKENESSNTENKEVNTSQNDN